MQKKLDSKHICLFLSAPTPPEILLRANNQSEMFCTHAACRAAEVNPSDPVPPSRSPGPPTPRRLAAWRRRLDNGLLIGGSDGAGGGGEEKLVGVEIKEDVPRHKRWWSTITASGGREGKSTLDINDGAATARTTTTTTAQHRRAVSYNTTYHVP